MKELVSSIVALWTQQRFMRAVGMVIMFVVAAPYWLGAMALILLICVFASGLRAVANLEPRLSFFKASAERLALWAIGLSITHDSEEQVPKDKPQP